MRTITKKYNIENIISRIPSLFPVLEINDDGVTEILKATDFRYGSYGKIVPNMLVPMMLYANKDIKVPYLYTKDKSYLYTYKTLMEYYYKYKDDKNRSVIENDVVSFIDNAIGKIIVDKKDKDGNNIYNDDQYLVPDFIYSANLLYLIEYYTSIKNSNSDICCGKNLYYKIGGDKMLEFLNSNKNIVLLKSQLFQTYALNLVDSRELLNINFNINLYKKEKDNGIKTIYSNEWEVGKTYESDEHSKLVEDGRQKKIGGEPIVYNDETYLCISKDKSSGKFDEKSKKILFDNSAFVKYPSKNYSRIKDEEIIKAYSNTVYSNKYNFFDGNKHVDKIDYEISGKTDSKLISLRKFKSFLNENELQTLPSDGEDWLSLYKIGIVDYNSSVDRLGNILHYGDRYNEVKTSDKTYVNNLYSYGSGIINIIRDSKNNKLTFYYVLNAHLNAEPDGEKIDDLGNHYYYFNNFEFDFCNDKISKDCIVSKYGKYNGILFIEEYYYDEESGINDITDFDSFIRTDELSVKKYPFKIKDSKISKIEIKGEYSTSIVRQASFFTNIENKKDSIYCPTFKEDFLSGITFYPKISKDIKILRGNNAAFERHIKLSEVKTMEDLENYQNGGFFNVQKIN